MISRKKIPQQGEIWLVEFPKSKESRKPFHPCLVISNDNQNIYDEEIIALPLTTEEVKLLQGKSNLLKFLLSLIKKLVWMKAVEY